MFRKLTNLTPDSMERFLAEGNVRGLLRGLRSNDPVVFAAAERGLIQIQPAPFQEICAVLTEKRSSFGLKQRAAGLLGKLRDPRAIPCLIEALQALPDRILPENRMLAAVLAQSLSTLGWLPSLDETGARYWCALENWPNCVSAQAAAVPSLIEELIVIYQIEEKYWTQSQSVTLQRVSGVLNELKVFSVPALLALVTTPIAQLSEEAHRQVQHQVIDLLAAMGTDVVPDLNRFLLSSNDSESLQQFILLSGRLKDDRSVKPLIEILRRIAKPLKSTVADALNQFDSQAGYLACIAAYQQWIDAVVWEPDEEGYDKDQLNDALVNLNYLERVIRNVNGNAVNALISGYTHAIEGSQTFKRFEKMITTINVAAIPALVNLLKSPNENHQRRAVNILEQLANWHPSSSTPQDQAYFAIAKRIRDSYAAQGKARADSGVCISLGQDAVPALINTLKNNNYQIRYDAARMLESLNYPTTDVETSIDRYVALHDLNACVACGSKAVKPLLQNLRDAVALLGLQSNVEMCQYSIDCCVQALVALGNSAKVDLVVCLEDLRQVAIRPYLVQILMQVGAPAAELLRNAGRDNPDDEVRYEITRILYHISTQDPAPQRDYFYAKMKDSSLRIKNLAIQYAVQNPDARSLRALRAIAENDQEDESNRKTALQVLAAQKDPANLPVLMRFAQNSSRDLQIIAVSGIEALGENADTPEVQLLLVDFLSGQQGRLQQGAARALAAIASPVIIEYLLDYLIQLDDEIALMTGRPNAETYVLRLRETRTLVVLTLAQIGEEVISALMSRKLEDGGRVRPSFIEIIGQLDREMARTFVINELHAPSANERYRASKYLQALHWEPDEEADGYEFLIQYALAISKWQEVLSFGERAVEPLKELLVYGDGPSREKAVDLLDQLDWVPSHADPIVYCQYWIVKHAYQKCLPVGEKAVEPLVEALKNTEEQLERSLSYGQGGNSELLKQRRTEIKNVLLALGRDIVPALTAHFLAPQTTERVRPHILHVLRHLGGKWFEDEMVDAMQYDPRLSIRRQSVWVLGELQVVAALPAMLALVEETNTEDEMKVELLLALRKVLSRPLETDLVEQIRAAAAKLIEWHDGGSPGIIENAIQVIRICDRKLS